MLFRCANSGQEDENAGLELAKSRGADGFYSSSVAGAAGGLRSNESWRVFPRSSHRSYNRKSPHQSLRSIWERTVDIVDRARIRWRGAILTFGIGKIVSREKSSPPPGFSTFWTLHPPRSSA
ncbi:hypothetical protein L1887_59840 [Cichorium endivia]|nr:hypothetical protein L1887_59840 [Cichorium endivia]